MLSAEYEHQFLVHCVEVGKKYDSDLMRKQNSYIYATDIYGAICRGVDKFVESKHWNASSNYQSGTYFLLRDLVDRTIPSAFSKPDEFLEWWDNAAKRYN